MFSHALALYWLDRARRDLIEQVPSHLATPRGWDKGIGIKPEDLHNLFRPFTQIDSSLAREYSGTGLGLSLVYRLVELHNGGIEVESTFGEGSRFTISLPWSPENTPPIPHLNGASWYVNQQRTNSYRTIQYTTDPSRR